MIFAELHGKLGDEGGNVHERSEDVLTSTAFGLLRYLHPKDGLLELVRRAQLVTLSQGTVRLHRQPEYFVSESTASCEVAFWSSLGPYGEPDVLLSLNDVTGRTTDLIVIECKLYSGKSGCADDDEEFCTDAPDPDQLVKYWQGLQVPATQRGVRASLLYLTAEASPPWEELAASLQRKPEMCLGWLSWLDVYRVARRCAPTSLAADDLCRLLRHKQLAAFEGFTGSHRSVSPGPARFWKGQLPSGSRASMTTFSGFTRDVMDAHSWRRRFWRSN